MEWKKTTKLMLVLAAVVQMIPVCATGTVVAADRASVSSDADTSPDVIAKVGDQTITFNEINTALNSSAIVGVSVPALGTPERDTARTILLDRFVSANLIYLDALKQGADKEPRYREQMTRFSNAILAGLYRKNVQAGDIEVTDAEIRDYFENNVTTDAEINDEIRLQIESTLRRERLHERLAAAQKTLRDDVEVKLYPENMDIEGDKTRADDVPLAEIDGEALTWGQMRNRIIAAGAGAVKKNILAFEGESRNKALQSEIDLRIMAKKASALGLDKDPVYTHRMNEYGKTLLTNMYRENLINKMEPSDKQIKAYYEANKSSIVIPEARKLHMVVVRDRETADDLKRKIESGEMTMYVAARDYSTAARAKQDLGEVGWVNRGETSPALDQMIFSLEPGELGGPVESPAGWHLVRVQDVRDAAFTDIQDDATRKLVRRKYLHDELDRYTADLRKNRFPVEVYEDHLIQLAQQEADMVKRLAEKARAPGSVTEKRVEELQKYMRPAN